MPVYGVGTDVVDVGRFTALIDSGGRRFLNRWFRPAEVEALLSGGEPARHTAARFAAKEAVLKSMGVPDVGPVRWRDIEVALDRRGLATVRLRGSVREYADAEGVASVHVSMTQHGRYATASAIAVTETAVTRRCSDAG